jgi:hypothetical protein
MFALRITFSLLLVITAFTLHAQNSVLVQVKGMVINSHREPLAFVHIIDRTSGKGVISRSDGEFNFFTEKGDTLLFSCVGYKKVRKIIPAIYPEKIYYLVVVLPVDTQMLPETKVFPWNNYDDFKEAILATRIPEDDFDRAVKNLALMELQQILFPDEMPSAPGAASRIYLYEYYDRLYWRGQTQPMQIFNIMAWQQFFEYLKEGKFKQYEKYRK